MGNPPFVGHQWRTKEQIQDMDIAFTDFNKHGKLDYVCAWYNKACDYMQGTKIKTAFVSTNSICQGESVPILWQHLINSKSLEIQFAYKTFVWESEAKNKAAVHVVIIGFTCIKTYDKKFLIDDNNNIDSVKEINGYLIDAPNVFIQSRGKPLFSVFGQMKKGSQPTDGNFLLLTQDEYQSFIKNWKKLE